MIDTLKRYLPALCALLLMISTAGIEASAAEIATANIPVTFHQDGNIPEEPEQFTVELIPADSSFPMPAESEAGVYRKQITAGTSDTVDIPCSRVGVFTYTVRQVPGENPHCIYDTTAYQVTVFVTYAQSGGVEVNIVAHIDGVEEKLDIEFSNYYSVPDGVTISAIKTLDGRTPGDGRFSFQLISSEGTVIETVKNKGKEVTFQTLFFDDIGTFTFTVKEIAGNDTTISYDRTVYEAVVEVVRDEKNDYAATLTYQKNQKEHTGTPTFANKTIPASPMTGDTSNILLYAAVFAISAAALVVVLCKKKRKEE